MGIDLSAYERRPSGICVIEGERAYTLSLNSDDEIVDFAEKIRPLVIAIDAPLTDKPELRGCDRMLIKMGFRVLPPSFSHMRKLSERGFLLSRRLRFEVIETFPTAVYKMMGVRKPRRKREIPEAARRLEEVTGIRLIREPKSLDELDSFVCAIVAREKGRGRAIAYGDSSGLIFLPVGESDSS
jgi:predicted nuclease with RNAse H fold